MYSREMLYGLAAMQEAQRFVWCYRPHRILRALKETLPLNCRRRPLLEQWLPSCRIYHGLNQRMPQAKAPRRIVTFHDLFVMTGDYSTAEFRARFTMQAKQAAERADLIIAVSQFTATIVEQLLGVERSRLRVVWHGAHPLQGEPVSDEQRENIVLHVGALQARKNIIRLVEAFEGMDQSWKLVLAGSSGYGAESIHQRIESSPARDRIERTGYVTDGMLDGLYRKAKILAFPSLDEGFGIPLLEAMTHGLPIVTSNGSALREVAGDAALQVDPMQSEQLREALKRLGADEWLRRKLAECGRKRAAEYTWQRAVMRTWEIYNEV